jgi:hypothetical protein
MLRSATLVTLKTCSQSGCHPSSLLVQARDQKVSNLSGAFVAHLGFAPARSRSMTVSRQTPAGSTAAPNTTCGVGSAVASVGAPVAMLLAPGAVAAVFINISELVSRAVSP